MQKRWRLKYSMYIGYELGRGQCTVEDLMIIIR